MNDVVYVSVMFFIICFLLTCGFVALLLTGRELRKLQTELALVKRRLARVEVGTGDVE